MEDFLFSLLAGLAEMLTEVLLEVVLTEGVASLMRAFGRALTAPLGSNRFLAATGLTLLGAGVGYWSVVLFPHPLVAQSRFHGISMVVSPVITGLVMSAVGRMLRNRGREPVEIESFGFGFAFALGVAFIRFLMVK
jgi:hypothetical protein